jgi:hypothetical protein
MPSSNNKVKDILSGCEDLLNDFSLPEEHSQRFVSIDLGNSVMSSPTITPGTNLNTPGVDSEHVQSKQAIKNAWERAIDKYVASVLEEEKSAGSSLAKSSKNRPHPDNHLLDALRIETASVSSIPHVKSDGHIFDDSSFEPIDPFGFDREAAYGGSNDSKVKQRIKQYLKEEWKPITLISLVILVTIIISATLNSDSSGGGNGKPENPVYVVDTASNIALEAESESPTYFPTASLSMTVPTYMPTQSQEESKISTLRPSMTVTVSLSLIMRLVFTSVICTLS